MLLGQLYYNYSKVLLGRECVPTQPQPKSQLNFPDSGPLGKLMSAVTDIILLCKTYRMLIYNRKIKT